ncbi:MAG: Putative iron-sulfur cluster assembly scaffold protein for SUF system, SufE2, partial [uncultured Nocardioidaceae bacterium]
DHAESRLAVPGDHPRPLQEPAACGSARAVRGRGAPREPDLRGRGDAAGAPVRLGRPRRDRRRVLRRRGVLDQPGRDVGDERPGDRQDGPRGARPPRAVPGHDARSRWGRARRGGPGGRRSVRRGRQVPGAGQVRATVVDGLEGRDIADHRRTRKQGATM